MSDPMFAILVTLLKKEYAEKGVVKAEIDVIKDAMVIYRKAIKSGGSDN